MKERVECEVLGKMDEKISVKKREKRVECEKGNGW